MPGDTGITTEGSSRRGQTTPLKSSNKRCAVCHGKIFLALVESNMAVKLCWENPPSDKINKPVFPEKKQGVYILYRKRDGVEGYFVVFH